MHKTMRENINENKVREYLIFFNSKFAHTETLIQNSEHGESESEEELVPAKRRSKKIIITDSGDEDATDEAKDTHKNEKEKSKKQKPKADNKFGLTNYYTKKIILKIWGFYNERFKQAWEQYVTETKTSSGLYLTTAILIEIICKYVSRKKAKMLENEKEHKEKRPTNKYGQVY